MEIMNKTEIYHYYEINHYHKALEGIAYQLSLNPLDSSMLLLRAEILYYTDLYDEALESCEQALGYDCDKETGYYLLANILMIKKDFKQSELAYLESLKFNPQAEYVIAAYGYLMYLTGNKKKAKELIKKAKEIDPNNDIVLHYQFTINLAEKDMIDVYDNINKMHSFSSINQVNLYIKTGLMYACEFKYRKAKEEFRLAFMLEPTNPYILEQLKEIDILIHPLLFINNIIEKLGGPWVVYIVFIVLILISKAVNLPLLLNAVLGVYIISIVLSWIGVFYYKTVNSNKK